MTILRESTSQLIRFGECVDATDGFTSEAGLTITQADMLLSKDGAAFAQKSVSGDADPDASADGWYFTTLSTDDTDTVGELLLRVHVAGMRPVVMRWYVVNQTIYDMLYASDSTGPTTADTELATLNTSIRTLALKGLNISVPSF